MTCLYVVTDAWIRSDRPMQILYYVGVSFLSHGLSWYHQDRAVTSTSHTSVLIFVSKSSFCSILEKPPQGKAVQVRNRGGKFVCVKSRLGGCEVTRVQAIENHALDGCPGIEKEGRLLSEAKGHGERERL